MSMRTVNSAPAFPGSLRMCHVQVKAFIASLSLAELSSFSDMATSDVQNGCFIPWVCSVKDEAGPC